MPTSQAQMTGQVARVDPARSSPCLGLCLGLMLDVFDVLPLEVDSLANLWTCQGSLANPMCRSERCASKPEVRTGQGNRTWIKQNRYILARVYIGIRMQCQRNMFSLDHFKFGIPFVFKDPTLGLKGRILSFAPGRKEQRSPADHDLRQDCLPMLGSWTNILFANLSKGAHILVWKEPL